MVVNLSLLTSNRKASNIFLLSSNPMNIVTAKECGFCVLPTSQFINDGPPDIELSLIEIYLLKYRYISKAKMKNNIDFSYLAVSNNQLLLLEKNQSNLVSDQAQASEMLSVV